MESLATRRARVFGPNVPTFYRHPLEIVRGEGVWLWDAEGRRYLDAYNNVPHVGHCHPHVVAAVSAQLGRLDTHSRYLHDGIVSYAERLLATFQGGLDRVLFACTGSEAMDVALRMAQAATGRTGIIATDTTYHGNTAAVSQLSTRRPPLGGRAAHIRLVAAPESGDDAGPFAQSVAEAAADLHREGHGVAALVVCPVFANEGLPDLPAGFLDGAADAVRAAGGLVIADEVQPGLGRLGSAMWGHQAMGLAPEIAVLGKSLGNGHPLAAVVAQAEVLAAFRRAFGYFNTTAATPVAAAAGSAVLDAMAEEELVENAHRSGAALAAALAPLAQHPGTARVTVRGLMAAVELRRPDGAPDGSRAEAVVERLKNDGVLIGRIARDMNVLKIRPPMPFAPDHVALLCAALDSALAAASAPA